MMIEKECAAHSWCCELQMQTQEGMTKSAVTANALLEIRTEITSSIKMKVGLCGLYGNRDIPSQMEEFAKNITKYVYRRSEKRRLQRCDKPISVIAPFALLSHHF
jgi:hypothetical protein